jgi:hypothetical protein
MMVGDREDYNLLKEMLIAFIGGGALGVCLLTIALVVVEFLKR